MESLVLKDISITLGQNLVFDKLSLEFNKKVNTSIIGPGGSGKTTICKILNGDLKYNGSILINGIEIGESNNYLLEKYVGVVLNNSYNKNSLVIDELFAGLDTCNLDYEEEEKRVKKVVKYFKLQDILEKRISSFTIQKKYYIKIIKELIRGCAYIVLDDIFINMDFKEVKRIISYCKQENITIINITSEMEYVLETDNLVVLYNKNVAMVGSTIECLKEEKLLRRLGFNLPFLVDLSIQLGYYGLINKVIIDNRKIIDAIWK